MVKKAEKNLAKSAVADFSLIDENLLKSRIYTIRGIKVMLDADLAEIYGYSTKAFNQQVKNNIEKFDEDFRFQLSRNEYREMPLCLYRARHIYAHDSPQGRTSDSPKQGVDTPFQANERLYRCRKSATARNRGNRPDCNADCSKYT